MRGFRVERLRQRVKRLCACAQRFLHGTGCQKAQHVRKELEKLISRTDKARADYYKYHTGREWTDARNYDLCLDSSKLGFERCVEEIKAYIDVRFK